MNTLIMDFPIRPFSVNKEKKVAVVHGKMRLVKNTSGKQGAARKELEMLALRYNRQLKDLGAMFDPKLHFWRMKYFWIYHEDEFWTKAGTMSQGLVDDDNPVKPFRDIIFGVVGMPDAYVANSEQTKMPGKETKCVIHISFHPWQELIP